MIVMKFGGTSVTDAPAMKNVIGIVSGNGNTPKLAVLSACSGVTDKLQEIIGKSAKNERDFVAIEIEKLEARHKDTVLGLIGRDSNKSTALQAVSDLFSEIRILAEGVSLLGECTPKSLDSCIAYGELLSTTIFYHACLDYGLDVFFADARTIMKTDSQFNNASVSFELLGKQARAHLEPLLLPCRVVVTQGFIGSAPDGSTTTIGRGGSDYSAAIFGAALGAEEIQIWTDVSGIMTADPRLVPQAGTLPSVTFSEVRELSFYGAKVLHPDTIKPAINGNIPVRVLNTMEPENPGTIISDTISTGLTGIHSIVLKQDCLFLKLITVFEENGVNILSSLIADFKILDIKVFGVSANESSLIAIIEKTGRTNDSISGLCEKYGLHKKDVSLLCLCGVIDSSCITDIFRYIAESAEEFNPTAVLSGVSGNSVLQVIPWENGIDALREAHKWFVEAMV